MWRAFFLAIGMSLCILGGECLVIEKAIFAQSEQQAQAPAFGVGAITSSAREIEPPEWAPWTLLSAGAVVLLYSFTVPKRVGG